jgi:hypothetical protein
MALVAIKDLRFGGMGGIVWEKTGDEGAIELDQRIADALVALPCEQFFIVNKSSAKAKKEVLTEVVEQTAEVVETPEVKETPTKRRSTKE